MRQLKKTNMKALFFGIYNKNDPVNARTRILLEGLKKRGWEVEECNTAVSSFERFWFLLKEYRKVGKDYDVMFLAYAGAQTVSVLAKILSKKKIVADPIISLYDTMVFDRKKVFRFGLKAAYYYALDWLTCRLCDVIIMDTDANADYFCRTFKTPISKFRRLFIGTEEKIMRPADDVKCGDKFLVHFHGFFIPLHGVEHIVKAAKLLEPENIEFNIVGRGQTYRQVRKISDELGVKNVNFMDPVSYDKIPDYMRKADVVLGIFGNTGKTSRVIPNKVYDAAAMGKAVLTADTPAIRELFSDGENCLLCQPADPEDIAAKIRILKNNPDLLKKISAGGYKLFQEKLKPEIIVAEFENILREAI